MYRGVPPQKSCAEAWVAACKAIMATGDEGYNVVIDVVDPVTHSEKDNEAITLVDKFLKLHDKYPIITVANTIFPQSLLEAHGPTEFYRVYHRDFDALSADSRRWGRYFDRMSRHQTKEGKEYNPLQEMIEKMKPKEAGQYKAAYELAVYDPLIDGRMFRGGQCLSFLSFKIHPENGLLLTAMYRNHTYITRLLGNLIGLARLMRFIATQAGLKLGSLTVVSTHAELDTEGWGIKDARELVFQAEGVLRR